MRLKSFFLLFFIIPICLFSYIIEVEKPVITGDQFITSLPRIQEPGQPMLPYIPIKLVIPMGEKYDSFTLDYTGNQTIIQNQYIEPAQNQQPMSGAFSNDTPVDFSIYEQEQIFPEYDYKILGTQRIKGYDLLIVNLYPYKYDPAMEEVVWYDRIEIEFTTITDPALEEIQNGFLISKSEVKEHISNMVINPERLTTYRKKPVVLSRELADPENPFMMVVITDSQREPYFTELMNKRNTEGIETGLFLVEDIYANYEGDNDADKVRNFIIDAYTTYAATDTPLEYVLLGGDDEIVPKRGCYGRVGWTIDQGIPCDLYYSNLDGDWNANDNNVYGEPEDDVDMLPEVAIGRIPAETEQEFANFFYKTFFYEDNIVISDEIAYMVGENLNWDPLTWGGDYKDEVAPIIDDNVHIFTLYDREGTYSAQNVKNAINSGVSIINHMGHSNETMVFGQNLGMASSYTNNEYGFAYSQGCYPAAFDNNTSGETESIAENLVIKEAGLFAFVGNTRYGWYSPGNTNGASQPYDIAFFEAIYYQDHRDLGNALQYSREVLVNEALSSDVMRWVYYEMVLFGDPTTEVKEPAGTFPYVMPATLDIVDIQGDGDSIVNPGEVIDIFYTLENLEGWADAEDVYAIISFDSEAIVVIQDSVYHGDIASGELSLTESFIIEIPQDCEYATYTYSLDIYATVNREVYFHEVFFDGLEVSLNQKYWPWIAENSIVSNPVCIDFNNDFNMDILTVNSLADIYLLDVFAQEQEGFPWINDDNIWKSTAVADIDQDDVLDVVIASRNGRIMAYNANGEMLFDYCDCVEQLLTPIINDITGDDVPEIISFGIDNSLTVLDSEGEILAGFPIYINAISYSEMASADIDDNGTNDILLGSLDGNLYGFDYTGSDLAGFPVALGFPIVSAPTVLDNKSIIVGTADSKMHIVSSNGEILVSRQLDSKLSNSAIAADFDNNSELDIALVTIFGGIYIIDQNGEDLPGWPQEQPVQFMNPPLAADLDGDDILDLVCLSTLNTMYAYHADGNEFAFSPVPTDLSGNTPSSIEDIDNDNDYELITGNTTGVLVLDVKLDQGNKLPWRTYRGNYRRTGYYGDNDLLGADESEVPVVTTVLYQNYPNPFNPITTISFNLKNAGNVDLTVFNILGQKVRTLIRNSYFESGLQEVIWDGRNENGSRVGSGIYFYRLNTDDNTSTRKMVLIK